MKLTAYGVDIAKSVFQVHSVDSETGEIMSKQIKLPPAKPEVYCWGASKALVTREQPEGGYSPNFIWS